MSQNGWIVIDKPLGLSSTQTTSKVKRLFSTKKAGHAGTLDPMATGILPIALGEATKTIPYMMDGLKAYEFTVRWGQQTTTDDGEGDVVAESDQRPSEQDIQGVLASFQGEITQTPPRYSAVKVNGKRAYKRARAGEEIEMKSRVVQIFSLSLIDTPDTDHARFVCECSKGTYIRSLGRDIALQLDTCGHLSQLRRTAVGGFSEKNAISLDFLSNISDKDPLEFLLPLDSVLDDIPGLVLGEEEERRFRQGQFLQKTGFNEGQVILCRDLYESVIGLAHMKEDQLRPLRVFNL